MTPRVETKARRVNVRADNVAPPVQGWWPSNSLFCRTQPKHWSSTCHPLRLCVLAWGVHGLPT